MRGTVRTLLIAVAPVFVSPAFAQAPGFQAPASITAGSAVSILTVGSGKATLFIDGPGGALRRDIQLGDTVTIPAGTLYNTGRYLVVLSAGTSRTSSVLAVLPAVTPDSLSFLAGPSRLPVGLHSGINGTVYVFDAYHNLVETAVPVSFTLSTPSGPSQTRTVSTRDGVAWTMMDSAARQGAAQFVARAGGIESNRVIDQVPGDPCNLSITAQPEGSKVALQTAPIRDCSGNPIPDGTIVTFSETYQGLQTTVDTPVKKDIASAIMPSVNGAVISVASGVVAGNQIRWNGGR